jgi:hypothetical protein
MRSAGLAVCPDSVLNPRSCCKRIRLRAGQSRVTSLYVRRGFSEFRGEVTQRPSWPCLANQSNGAARGVNAHAASDVEDAWTDTNPTRQF